MSRARIYQEDTTDTIRRFYEALEAVKAAKVIRGYRTYCDMYNIDRRHFYAQKNDMGRGYFEIGWAIPLIRDFHVSARWLLLGRGDMFL